MRQGFFYVALTAAVTVALALAILSLLTAGTGGPPRLTCDEAARVFTAIAASNQAKFKSVTCASVTRLNSHDYEAVIDVVAEGETTIHSWRMKFSRDEWIMTGAEQTGTRTPPVN